MKKLVIAAVALMVSIAATYAQGQINFATKVGTGATAANAKALLTGGAAATTPPAAAALQLDNGAGAFTLIPGSLTSFRSGAAVGYVTPLVATIPGHDIGSTARVRVVGFLGGATQADYEAALAAGNVGFSAAITTPQLGGGTIPPPNLEGLTGEFTIAPEPSTIAFGLLGAAALLIRRRK